MHPDRWQQVKELFAAALDRPGAERAGFLAQVCGDDETLRSEVDSLLAAHASAGSFIETPPATDLAGDWPEAADVSLEGRHVGRYRLLRRVGQGGMGTVYLAERADDAFRKHVAVKLIRPGRDAAAVLHRFQTERQTLADLDHPNIAKLLDGGASDDGIQYLVMEYIDGSPIDEFCDRERLKVRDRVALFRTVCSAVQAAHRSLVVHRDIKPSNILVTRSGEPTLLDFGIAKILGPGQLATASFTQTCERMMTPDYASPEQLRGRPITTLTDIYSLGVLLYRLLTGHHPYRLDGLSPGEMERVVCEQEPPRPSTALGRRSETQSSPHPPREESGVKPDQLRANHSHRAAGVQPAAGSAHAARERGAGGSPAMSENETAGEPPAPRLPREGFKRLKRELSGDLDRIVLTALRKEPRERYQSADALADDLERWLRGEPVRARPVGSVGRLARWCRRNPRVAALSGAVLTLVVLLAIGSSVATVMIAGAYSRVSAERERAVNAGALAEENARVAREQRALALDAINILVVKVQNQLETRAGTLHLREEILGDALKQLDQITRQPGDIERDRSIAVAHQRIGDILWLQGRTDEARRRYEHSRTMAESLLDDDPTNCQLKRDVADAIEKLGNLAQQAFNAPEAIRLYDEALVLRRKPAEDNPADAGIQRELAATYSRLGETNWNDRKVATAREHFGVCVAILDRMRARRATDPETKRLLVRNYGRLALTSGTLRARATAESYFRKAIELGESLTAQDPYDDQALRELQNVWQVFAYFLLEASQFEAAEPLLQKSLAACQALADREPDNSERQWDLFLQHQRIGFARLGAGDVAAARDHFVKCVEILTPIVESRPAATKFQNNLMTVLFSLAELETRVEDYTASRAWCEQAMAIGDRLESSGQLVDPVLQFFNAYTRHWHKAVAIVAENTASGPTVAESPELSLITIGLYAQGLAKRGQHREAAALADDVCALRFSGPVYPLVRLGVLARIFGVCAAAIDRQPGIVEQLAELRAEYVRSGVEALNELQQLHLELFWAGTEPDLAALRDDPGYQALLHGSDVRPTRPEPSSAVGP